MNRCTVCNVNVHPQHKVCPLCGKGVGMPAQSVTAYPRYTTITGFEKRGSQVWKLLLFLVISTSVITGFINVMTLGTEPGLWAVTVAVSLVLPYTIGRIIRTKRNGTGGKIMYSYLTLSAYLIIIDVFNGFNKWSTTYVIPFLTIAVTIVFTIIAISDNANLREYAGYLLGVFFISLCPVIIFLFSLSLSAWTSFVSVLYCLLTIIGLLIFNGKNFKREIKKQFHL